MSEMKEFVCWKNESILKATPRDAAALNSAYFQLVHHPLRLRRRPLESPTGGSWIEERDVITDLMGSLRPDGYILLPVVGNSGTGKSHLVRWVYERSREKANWVSRYLPKNRTSIRRVIELVIEDLDGDAIERARKALQSAPVERDSEEILAQRLLDELALILGQEPAMRTGPDDGQKAQLAQKLQRGLPDLLHDPVVRRSLTEPGGVIPRLVGLAMSGRRHDDGLDDDAIYISDADLPPASALSSASETARTFFGQLKSLIVLRTAAIDAINAALPLAIKRVFVSNHVDLIEIFREIRRKLHADGMELVLFIEDLTVLHGVEREFLDAIVEPSRSDQGDLCPLRVLFAVTSGHFDGLDTVRTRCDDAYWFDAEYEDGTNDTIALQEATSFLGRYLNASRLRHEEVQTAWEEQSAETSFPNACDSCIHKETCHNTFGTSPEGYGLYPFNITATDCFIRSVSGERFNPREIVRALASRFLLIAGEDLRSGEFPSKNLLEPFEKSVPALDPLFGTELERKFPGEGARRSNTYRYWASGSINSLSLPDDLLAAFGLSRSNGQEVIRGGTGSGTTTPTPTPRSPSPPPKNRIIDELSEWSGRSQDLTTTTTNDLKKLVWKAVRTNITHSTLAVRLNDDFDKSRFNHIKHIFIEGSSTQQRKSHAYITLARDTRTASALQGLVILDRGLTNYSKDATDMYRRAVASELEQWTKQVSNQLDTLIAPEAVNAVECLVVCALVTGASQGLITPIAILKQLFTSAVDQDFAGRSERWIECVREAQELQRKLRPLVEAHFGESRSTGSVRAVRSDLLLPIIETFLKSDRLQSDDSGMNRFMRKVDSTYRNELASVATMAERATQVLDMKRSWEDHITSVLEVVRIAHTSGRLRKPDTLSILNRLASDSSQAVHTEVGRAISVIGQAVTTYEQLTIIGSSIPRHVLEVDGFLSAASEVMDDIEKDLDERGDASSPNGNLDLQDISSAILRLTDEISSTLDSLR